MFNPRTLAMVESLAVRYNAYLEASKEFEQGPLAGSFKAARSVTVWGDMLLEIMEQMGSKLLDPEAVRKNVQYMRGYLENEKKVVFFNAKEVA